MRAATQGTPSAPTATAGVLGVCRPPTVCQVVPSPRTTTLPEPMPPLSPTAQMSLEDNPSSDWMVSCCWFSPTSTVRHAVPFQWNSTGPMNPFHHPLPAAHTSSGAKALTVLTKQKLGKPPPATHSVGG